MQLFFFAFYLNRLILKFPAIYRESSCIMLPETGEFIYYLITYLNPIPNARVDAVDGAK